MSAPVDAAVLPDPMTEHFKKDVDRTLLREHITPTPQLEKRVALVRSLDELRAARRRGKDREALAQPEAILKERDRSGG
jgi:hypothetical protein